MNGDFFSSINIFYALIAGLVIILIDYMKQHQADKVQRRVFVSIISCTLLAMFSELGYEFLRGLAGDWVNVFLLWINTFYFLFQVTAYALLVLFLDYYAQGSMDRVKKLGVIVGLAWTFLVMNLALNLSMGHIFYITPDNYYVHSDYFFVHAIGAYSFVVIILINVLLTRNHINRGLYTLLTLSTLPIVLGTAIDITIPGARLTWPSFYASLLFAYLFIVRMNTLVDSLTGIHNRRSLDDHLLWLSKISRRKDYSFIMIDMDEFKKINDTFGHAQGDNALRDVAELLRGSIRSTDFVARMGGDEFLIIASTGEPDKIIKHVTQRLHEFNKEKNRPYHLMFSCGGGVYPPHDARTPEEFLSYVDGLMYDKKAERKEKREVQLLFGKYPTLLR